MHLYLLSPMAKGSSMGSVVSGETDSTSQHSSEGTRLDEITVLDSQNSGSMKNLDESALMIHS